MGADPTTDSTTLGLVRINGDREQKSRKMCAKDMGRFQLTDRT